MIKISDLSHTFRARKSVRTALRNVTFDVHTGEIFALLGPNGGGKTTLFRILSTLLKPETGRASIDGIPLSTQPNDVRRRIGVVFQTCSLDRKLTVRENMEHYGHLYGLRGRLLHSAIDALLDRFALADRAGDLAAVLSGGLQRRVEILKALLPQPKVLLLDEPSTGLDPSARLDLWTMLKESKATVLLTTHLLEEAERAARVGILHEGRLVASGTPDALCSEIQDHVITLETATPEHLREAVSRQFGSEAQIVNSSLRIQCADGHKLAATLREFFGPEIRSLTVRRPSLEDVFLKKTGKVFE